MAGSLPKISSSRPSRRALEVPMSRPSGFHMVSLSRLTRRRRLTCVQAALATHLHSYVGKWCTMAGGPSYTTEPGGRTHPLGGTASLKVPAYVRLPCLQRFVIPPLGPPCVRAG
ncbi:hypothetical protein LY76DRAFT_593370 [Colletotrichum caudatum]|nr:hypothetical protein LY76DRAFT_593370 [Colletotrichum caudatum]